MEQVLYIFIYPYTHSSNQRNKLSYSEFGRQGRHLRESLGGSGSRKERKENAVIPFQ